MTARAALVLGALFAFAAVALGAFGAHALKARLSPECRACGRPRSSITPGTRSRCSPSALLMLQRPGAAGLGFAAWLFVAGIVLFSGSLYALALTGVRSLGAVTPVGGLAFLGGWVALAWSAWRGL